jgi:LysR family glycine cleavage system transcriptional activator
MPSLPPLSALRAFEAAARHNSFTKAADELCVTQSAVSRHIRYLEDRLQVLLFVRGHRSLTLTPEGQRYFDDLSGLFRQMAWATERLTNKSKQELLQLHCHTTFAHRWLIPRLQTFLERHPEVDLRISASTWVAEPEREQVHALISSSSASSVGAERLFSYTMVPVCTPEYRASTLPMGNPEELENAVLIHALGAPASWATWLDTCQMGSTRGSREIRVETTTLAITAALNGLGVSIASLPFVRSEIEAGRLVIPLPYIVSLSVAFWYWPVGQSSKMSAVRKFREWLLEEAADEDRIPSELTQLRVTGFLS